MVAVSVDGPEKSEALRIQLALPFPILCDTERRAIQAWGIYNPREGGGIAEPAVFLIDPGRVVRYAAVDGVAKRVPPAEIVGLLKNRAEARPLQRKVYIPLLRDWIRAIRNGFRR